MYYLSYRGSASYLTQACYHTLPYTTCTTNIASRRALLRGHRRTKGEESNWAMAKSPKG